MNASQKALAVQSILVRDLATANGDAAATAESAANKTKKLEKALKEQATEIGITSLPAILQLVEGLGALLTITADLMDTVGTKVGEMFYGPTDETLEKWRKQEELVKATRQARKELNDEGGFEDVGFFEVPLFSKDATRRMEHNADVLEKRIQKILKENEAASEKSVEATKKEIEATEELVEVETDETREKANRDRIKAVQDLINSAGELTGIQTTLTEKEKEQLEIEKDRKKLSDKKLNLLKAEAAQDSAAVREAQKQLNLEQSVQDIMQSTNVDRQTAINLAKDLAKVESGADTNQSGYVTPREQRAFERKQKKERREQGKRELDERMAERTEGQRRKQAETDFFMSGGQRNRDGSYPDHIYDNLNNNPTKKGNQDMQGTQPTDGTGVGGETAEDNKDSQELITKAKETAQNTKDILTEIKKNPS